MLQLDSGLCTFHQSTQCHMLVRSSCISSVYTVPHGDHVVHFTSQHSTTWWSDYCVSHLSTQYHMVVRWKVYETNSNSLSLRANVLCSPANVFCSQSMVLCSPVIGLCSPAIVFFSSAIVLCAHQQKFSVFTKNSFRFTSKGSQCSPGIVSLFSSNKSLFTSSSSLCSPAIVLCSPAVVLCVLQQ